MNISRLNKRNENVYEQLRKLQAENKQLKEDLIEFGRHQPGCPYQYDKKYHCKCGWLKVKQALRG